MNETRPDTNEALGVQLGVSHATVSRWRSGDRIPSPVVMVKISRLLGWALEDQIMAAERQRVDETNFDYRDGFIERSVAVVGPKAAKKGPSTKKKPGR